MKIAVTAATGSLGSAIVKALMEHPSQPEVIGVSRNPDRITDPAIEYRSGDYNDPESYGTAFEGIDRVLLVSGMDDPSNRVVQHRNVIEAAKIAGIERIVYTSIIGSSDETGFSPVVSSNRQTESDIRVSGLEWVIGRNGLYLEPDLEYVENYIAAGKIANCGGMGKCGYTTRSELADAYAQMLLGETHTQQTYNLAGPAITQQELVDLFNAHFDLNLEFEDMSVQEYRKERQSELGEFLGHIIAGIYEGIRLGFANPPSHFETASGRPHMQWAPFFEAVGSEWKSRY